MTKKHSAEQFDAVDEVLLDWSRERPELDTTAIGVFARISRLHVRQRALLHEIYEDYGLTLPSFDVLANLRRSGYPHRKTAGELASSSMLSTGGITFRLDRLEEQGLVERVRTPSDRRKIYAQLTARGLEVIDEVFVRHVDSEREMLGELSPQAIEQLTKLLRTAERSIASYGTRSAAGQVDDAS